MEAAFVLEVGAPGPPGLPAPTAPAAASDADLGFAPRRRRTWTAGRLRLSIWQGDDNDGASAWSEVDGGISFVTGHVRFRGRPWDDRGAWAPGFAARGAAAAAANLEEELWGIFAGGHLTAGGDGWVATDPLGLRCLYRAVDGGRTIIASRAALAAAALAGSHHDPVRDPVAGTWLALTGYHVGDATGYAGVRVVPAGQLLRLSAGEASVEHGAPVLAAGDQPPVPVEEVADVVIDDVGDSLRAILSHPAERHVLDLTGGKDSRLVLAVALLAGIADDFEYETVGPPGLPDVEIAQQLAGTLGLRHQARFVGLRRPGPYAGRVHTFIESTAGMVNGWAASFPLPSQELRVTGIGGEMLRAFLTVPDEQQQEGDLGEGRHRLGHLGLVRGPVAAQRRAELRDRLATRPTAAATAVDRIHAHYVDSTLRFSRLGPREEIARTLRVHPLCSPRSVRAAMGLDPLERQSELLVAEILRRSSDSLVRHPFAGRGWDERAAAHLRSRSARPAPPSRASRGPSPRGPAVASPPPVGHQHLVELLHHEGGEERMALLHATFAGDSPAWEVLDRARAREALARWPSLGTRPRRELFGAATAAIWSAGGRDAAAALS